MTVTNYFGDPRDSTDDTPFDGFKHKSLNAAGYAYLLGDAALFASGAMSGRGKEAATGLLWAAGGLAPARYANPNGEKQCRILAERLGDYLRKEGIKIPDAPDLKELTKPNGVIEHVESFLYKYPSQVLNVAYGLGSIQLMRSGIQHNKKWDAASGALVAAGALAGVLVSEKPEATSEEKKKMSPLGSAINWVQEKPLRLSGILYTLNNATLLKSAFNEQRANPAQKSYMFKYLTAASYIFGNGCLALSSKDQHTNDSHAQEALEKLTTAAARIIAAQPEKTQQTLLRHIAGFIAAQPEVGVTAENIHAAMQHKITDVQKQHAAMFTHSTWSQRVQKNSSDSPTPQL